MRRILTFLTAVLVTMVASAQTESGTTLPKEDRDDASIGQTWTAEPVGDLQSSLEFLPQDSLHLPSLNWRGQKPLNMYPYWGWMSGMGYWNLHQGLNMNLGASVFGSWGDSKYLGTGFTQNVSLMYAMPLTNKLSLAVGGWFSNVYFAHDSFQDAGLNAMLSYRFNEHWEAHIYGQKSLVKNDRPMPFYGYGNIGDRIGAGVRYSPNPTLSFEVNVEYMDMPNYYVPMPYVNRNQMNPSNHGAPPSLR